MEEQDDGGDAIATCVRRLNHTIGELARNHGVAAVVAALSEVIGCSFCVTDRIERGTSVRSLLERISLLQRQR